MERLARIAQYAARVVTHARPRHKLALHVAAIMLTSAMLLGMLATLVNLAALPLAGVIVLVIHAIGLATYLGDWIYGAFAIETAHDKHLEQIPVAEVNTIVFIPTLLVSIGHFKSVCDAMLANFKSCAASAVYFVIFLDYPDTREHQSPSADELALYNACAAYLEFLNTHPSLKEKRFFCVIRDRTWSDSESAYIGRERKRGKFEELIRLCRAMPSEYFMCESDCAVLRRAKYVITIDDDCIFARGGIEHLIQAMQRQEVVLSEDGGRVIAGHGLLVPRSVNRFEKNGQIKYGKSDFWFEWNAVLHKYYGECVFSGKAIIDIDAYSKTTLGKMPNERILSHDYIEGSHLRPAYCAQSILSEMPPSSLFKRQMRDERWMRGDLQNFVFVFLHKISPWVVEVPIVIKWKIIAAVARFSSSMLYFGVMAYLIAARQFPADLLFSWVFLWGASSLVFIGVFRLVSRPLSGKRFSWLLACKTIYSLCAAVYAAIAIIPTKAVASASVYARVLHTLVTKKGFLCWQASSIVETNASARPPGYVMLINLLPLPLVVLLGWFARPLDPAAMLLLVLWLSPPLYALYKMAGLSKT